MSLGSGVSVHGSRRARVGRVKGSLWVYVLIGEGGDLLLGLLVVCKLLLVLLPALPSCTRHLGRQGALFVGRCVSELVGFDNVKAGREEAIQVSNQVSLL